MAGTFTSLDLVLFFVFWEMFFVSSRRRHTISLRDWSSDVCSSDLAVCVGEWVRRLSARGGEGLGPYRGRAIRRPVHLIRSEERRVGKECRVRSGTQDGKKFLRCIQSRRVHRDSHVVFLGLSCPVAC